MKTQLIAAGAAAVAAGALGLGIPAAEHTQHHADVALTASDPNAFLLELEGVSPLTSAPPQPLGIEIASNPDFYNVATSNTDPTPAANDLLNSSLVLQANELTGIGDTNGYIGLSPTTTPDVFTFQDQEGVDFDHGLQALLTAYNQPLISLEEAVNATTPGTFNPAELNLDPAEITNISSPLAQFTELSTAFTDFTQAADLAFGLTL